MIPKPPPCQHCEEARRKLIDGIRNGEFSQIMEAIAQGAQVIFDKTTGTSRALTEQERAFFTSPDPEAFLDQMMATQQNMDKKP